MTVNEQIKELCARLRLYAMPRLVDSEAHTAREQDKTYTEFLRDLLTREVQERDSRDFQRRLRAASLPARHDLDMFDHNYSQGMTAPRLRELRQLGWLEQNYNIILMGPSGTGKTFMASGLVYEAVRQGYKAYLVTMEDVVNTIKMKSVMPSAMAAYNRLLKADLVAIDDIMLFSVRKEDAAGFFNLINTLHEKASLIITTNKAPTEWAKTLDDEVLASAILDRLLYHCEVVKLSDKATEWETESQFSPTIQTQQMPGVPRHLLTTIKLLNQYDFINIASINNVHLTLPKIVHLKFAYYKILPTNGSCGDFFRRMQKNTPSRRVHQLRANRL